MPARTDLHPYQERAVAYIKSHPSCGLFLPMGMGKTVSTLTAIAELKLSRVLVIAPLRVARDTWADEIAKWEHLRHLRAAVAVGSEKKRREAIESEAVLYIINRENVQWLFKTYPNLEFDMIVIDELSSFKNHTSARFKTLKKHRAPRMVGLTGTPSPNGMMDLWAEIFLLDGGERLYPRITQFRNVFFSPGQSNGYVVYNWILKPGANEAITERISDITVSMSTDELKSLPPVQYLTENVYLSTEDMQRYKQFKRTLVAELGGETVTAANAAVLSGKLRQWASGAMYDDDGGVVRLHDAKLEALKEIAEFSDSNILVAYNYKHDRERIMEAIPEAVDLRSSESLRAWNEGKIRVALGHPASMGHGLNIQRGGNVIVWFSLTWNLEEYQQFNARLHRQGQANPVQIYHLVAVGTIDERILKILSGKDTLQMGLLDELQLKPSDSRGNGSILDFNAEVVQTYV